MGRVQGVNKAWFLSPTFAMFRDETRVIRLVIHQIPSTGHVIILRRCRRRVGDVPPRVSGHAAEVKLGRRSTTPWTVSVVEVRVFPLLNIALSDHPHPHPHPHPRKTPRAWAIISSISFIDIILVLHLLSWPSEDEIKRTSPGDN